MESLTNKHIHQNLKSLLIKENTQAHPLRKISLHTTHRSNCVHILTIKENQNAIMGTNFQTCFYLFWGVFCFAVFSWKTRETDQEKSFKHWWLPKCPQQPGTPNAVWASHGNGRDASTGATACLSWKLDGKRSSRDMNQAFWMGGRYSKQWFNNHSK